MSSVTEMAASEHALHITGLCKGFGGLKVLEDFSLVIPREADTAVAVLGQNGAGKTTLLNLITRLLPVDSGAITVDGVDVVPLPSRALAHQGVGRTFQSPRLLVDDTVIDNVLLGAVTQRTWRRGGRAAHVERAEAALEQVGLHDLARRPIRSLPFGSRKLVELARALVSQPRLLLLDEPAAGLSQVEEERLAQILVQLRQSGVILLLIEHRMLLVTAVAKRVVMMDSGRIVFDGSVNEALESPIVREGYLGTKATEHVGSRGTK